MNGKGNQIVSEKPNGKRLSCVTRSMAAAATAIKTQNTAGTVTGDPSFANLPIEMKHEVLSRLPFYDMKKARLVCVEWMLICKDYISSDPVLSFKTVKYLKTLVRSQYDKLKITSFARPCARIMSSPLPIGKNIRVLTMKDPLFKLENLKWILTSCYNLEEIRIEFTNSKRRWAEVTEFMSSILPNSAHLCRNLKKFEISVMQSQENMYYEIDEESDDEEINDTAMQVVQFDCGPLRFCKKLEQLSIRSVAPFEMKNCDQLPPTLRRFNALLLLNQKSLRYHNQVFENLCTQFPDSRDSRYLLSLQNSALLQRHFPDIHTTKLVPTQVAEWDVLRKFLPNIVNQIPIHRKNRLRITSLINFSVINSTEAMNLLKKK